MQHTYINMNDYEWALCEEPVSECICLLEKYATYIFRQIAKVRRLNMSFIWLCVVIQTFRNLAAHFEKLRYIIW